MPTIEITIKNYFSTGELKMGLSFPNPIDAVKSAYNHVEDAGEAVVKTTVNVSEAAFNATENAAVSAFHFEAAVTKFALNKTFDGAKTVAATTVNLADKGIDFVGDGFDRLTHPGDSNPLAAQGLEFSETKSATNLAYDAKAGESYKFPNGEHWKVVDVSEDKDSGFRAVALQSADPNDKRTIVAFAGTDPTSGKDWIADGAQGLGLPTAQYKEAVDFADKWKAAAGDNVILTGHSLGGGLASYASIQTGLKATALNSAPLAINHLGGNPLSSSVRNNPNITQYYVPGEILTVIDDENPLDARPGNQIAVEGKHSILNPAAVILNHLGGSAAPDIAGPTLDK